MSEEYEYEGDERRVLCQCSNKKQFEILCAERDDSQKFRAQAKIAGIITLAIFASAFVYPTLLANSQDKKYEESITVQRRLKAESVKMHDDMRRLIRNNEQEVNKVESDIRVSNDRYQRVINDLGKIEGKIDDLTDLLKQ